MKTCTKCGESKQIDMFSVCRRSSGGRQSHCKDCNAKYRADNLARKKTYQKSRYWDNRDRLLDLSRAYRKEKGSELNARRREYFYQYNRESVELRNAQSSRYRAAKLLAVPKWFDACLVRDVYALAKARTIETGVPHHVDHIVPLVSEIVCGLHCQQNLQVIPGFDNRSKSNRHWPDMP